MSGEIQLYCQNATDQGVGAQDGINLQELQGQIGGRISEITEMMEQNRQKGKQAAGSDPNRKIDFHDLPYRDLPYRDDMTERVKKLAAQLKGRFENLVVLGIGGSALGNIALQTALNSPMYNLLAKGKRPGPRLFVIDNVDPVQFGSLLELLEGELENTLFNVISKSGETAETASQYLTVREMLLSKGLKLAEHIVATTDTKAGTMRKIVDEEGFTSLEVPEGVGGRFSVLSDVGLFSAAMCGIDIDQLLAGARAMDKRVSNKSLMDNPAALFAAFQYGFYQKGKRLSVMMPYSYQLKDLCDWYRQLWAESLGKCQDRKGNDIQNVGPTPIKALGTTDQHSQVQLYREGPNDKVFTFLEVEQFSRDVVIGDAGGAKELAYLTKKNMSDLLNNEKRGTEYALLESHRPCLTVHFPEINAHAVGEFIYMFEVATSYMGELFNIDTYNQPAVQLGKQATFALMGHEDYQELADNIKAKIKI